MQGLMMDYQLNVPAILRRGEELFGHKTIASRLPDKSWHTYTYADFARRAEAARARAARRARPRRRRPRRRRSRGTTTSTWRRTSALPIGGFVTHTLNLRLHPDDLTYIATHAGDRVLIADKMLWPLVEAVQGPRRLRARDRDRRRRDAPTARSSSRSCSRRPTPRRSPTGTSTSAPRRRCVTRAARPGSRRASSTRIARSRSTRSPRRSRARSGSARPTSCCPSCRCSTRTRGASRSRARSSASKQVFPGPHLDPVVAARRIRRAEGDRHRRRADDLDRDPAAARRRARTAWDLSRLRIDDRRRRRRPAGDDRGLRASATASTSSTPGA